MTRRFSFPWRSRARIAAAVDDELQFHIDMRTAEIVRGGTSETEARALAVAEFGDLERARRVCRAEDMTAERGLRIQARFDELRGNVAYAFRSLKRSPGFTAVALVTLALAIGANTAVFSVANAVLLAPLPYGHAERLVFIYENNTPNHNPTSQMSAADIMDYREMQRSFTSVGALAVANLTLRNGDADPTVLRSLRVTANLFDLLEARPLLGRTFAPGEDEAARRHVAVLGHALWQNGFGGDTAVIGKVVTLSDESYEVIGVMPAGFAVGFREELWVPVDMQPTLSDPDRARKFHMFYALARLQPGVKVEAARADLDIAARALESRYPDANTGHLVTVMPIQAALAGDTRTTTFILLGAAGLVLLIACANLTNVMLARGVSRRREMTVRSAIGAGRGHLIRQLLTESFVLAVVGGGVGTALAVVGIRLITTYGAVMLPAMAQVVLDWRVLAFCALVSVGMGIVIGLVPALGAVRVDLNSALQQSQRSSAGDQHGERLRGALVFFQITTAVVLLAAAGLLLRSLDALRDVGLGFEPAQVVTARVEVRGPRYRTTESVNVLYDAILGTVRSTPGIVAVGATTSVPLVGSSGCGLVIEGRSLPAAGYDETLCLSVRGDYFRAMDTPLLRGRMFDATDLPNGPQVVLINAAAARRFWPGEDPIGQRIRLGPSTTVPLETVIGIVGDMRQDGLEPAAEPIVYEYDLQHGWGSLSIVVRTTGEPLAAVPAIRAAVRAADPALAVRQVMTMDQIIGRNLATRTFSLGVILAFALLALSLAAVGVYGVLAYSVTSRTREFGIRMALGASASTVRSLVLRKGLLWSTAGLGVGIGVALAGGRWIEGMLYEVRANDAATFVVVGASLFAVVLLACLVPARRATRVDPISALRDSAWT